MTPIYIKEKKKSDKYPFWLLTTNEIRMCSEKMDEFKETSFFECNLYSTTQYVILYIISVWKCHEV